MSNCRHAAATVRATAVEQLEQAGTSVIIIRCRRPRTNSGPDLMRVHEPDFVSRPSARDGFIIVAVLWIMIALATLASIYSVYVSNSALAISVMDDGLQAEQLVYASLELTSYRLTVSTG